MARFPSPALLAVLADNIRRYRQAKGLSQEALPSSVVCTGPTSGSLERQERKSPRTRETAYQVLVHAAKIFH